MYVGCWCVLHCNTCKLAQLHSADAEPLTEPATQRLTHLQISAAAVAENSCWPGVEAARVSAGA